VHFLHVAYGIQGFIDDIEKLTEDNSDFRRVLDTGQQMRSSSWP